jgi:predicted nucleic acid-binding protein
VKGYLLDTNLISELLKKRPSAQVLDRLRAVREEALFTSAICVMELRYGAARHPAGEQLWERIKHEALLRVQILPVGPEEADKAGEVLAMLEACGKPIGVEDVLIGATALVHGLAVVTRNIKHLSRIQRLRVESWWD